MLALLFLQGNCNMAKVKRIVRRKPKVKRNCPLCKKVKQLIKHVKKGRLRS